MHDLIIAGLPEDGTIYPELAAELAKRRDLGLARYGQPLQAHNRRDPIRDLLEECLDGMAYARQALIESPSWGLGEAATMPLKVIEDRLLGAAVLVLMLRAARDAATPNSMSMDVREQT